MTDFQTPDASIARIAAADLQYDTLPDFDVFDTAAWAVQDSIGRAACR